MGPPAGRLSLGFLMKYKIRIKIPGLCPIDFEKDYAKQEVQMLFEYLEARHIDITKVELMRYKYRIKRPSGADFNPGDLIINRDESEDGAISLLEWLQDAFGKENVTLWRVIDKSYLEQVRK